MRKGLYILIFIFTFFTGINNINASISYDITSMNINGNSIVFEGWAIVVGENNYGGYTSNIEMAARGTGGELDGETSLINIGDSSNNFYPIMCQNECDGRSADCPGKNLCRYESKSRCSNGDCVYRNVYFRSTFKIDDLLKIGQNVQFFITVHYDDEENVSNSEVLGYSPKDTFDSSEKTGAIGVYKMNCKNGNSLCETGINKVSNGSATINIEIREINNNGSLIANNTYIQDCRNGVCKKLSNECILRRRADQKLRLELDGLFQNMAYGLSKYYDGFAQNQLLKVKGYHTNRVCSGYLYASWLEVDNTLTLNFEKTEKEAECTVSDDAKLNCQDKTFDSSCTYDINTGKEVTIKYPVDNYEKGCQDSDTEEVTGRIKIKQTGNLEFSLPNSEIYSGGGFTFSILYENKAYWEHVSGECPSVKSYMSCIPFMESCFCFGEKTYYSEECNSQYQYSKIIAKKVTPKYLGVSGSIATVTMPDSNTVNGGSNSNTGKWECTADKISGDWMPGKDNAIEQECTFTLHDAYINRVTSEVKYGSTYSGNNDYLDGNSSSGEPMYYIPLKWPSGNTFLVKAIITGLSSISGMNWSAEYECGVDCEQKLYDLDNGGYLYYFRPIALSNPFPNGRTPGINWINWINNTANKKRLLETYTTDNNLEYTVQLTNTDIANIKVYNERKNYASGRGYLDYSIDKNGNSEFIKDYDYFINGNVTHSALGVYSAGDDVQ